MNIAGHEFKRINAIGLQNYDISGTVFMASLLDGHPNIAPMPGINTMGFYDFWETIKALNDNERIHAFVEGHPCWFDEIGSTMGRVGDNADQKVWADPTRFLEIAKSGFSKDRLLSRREFFQLVNISYNLAIDRQLSSDIYVIFHVHNMPLETVTQFYSDFPDAKVIYMIRNIKGNFASLSRQLFAEENGPPENVWKCNLNQLLLGKFHYVGNFEVFRDRPHQPEYLNNCTAVRLEDVHSHPKSILTALCRWLDIPWDDSLLKSTFDGKLWWNKGRKESPVVQGFKPQLPYRGIKDQLSLLDRLRLDIISHRKAKFWRYKTSVDWLPNYFRFVLLRLLLRRPLLLEKTRGNPSKEHFDSLRQYMLTTASTVENQGAIEVPLLPMDEFKD